MDVYSVRKSKVNPIAKTASYGFIFVVVFMLCGCVRWHCPAFPEDLALYAPYSENQNVQFTDGTDRSVSLTVKSILKTTPQKLKYLCKCTCNLPVYSIKLEYSDDTSLHFLIAVPFVGNNAYTDEIDMTGTKYLLNNGEIDWSGLFSDDPLYSTLDSVAYETHPNNDEILFTSKPNLRNPVFFDSVKVVKGVGITSFCTNDGRKYHLDM